MNTSKMMKVHDHLIFKGILRVEGEISHGDEFFKCTEKASYTCMKKYVLHPGLSSLIPLSYYQE